MKCTHVIAQQFWNTCQIMARVDLNTCQIMAHVDLNTCQIMARVDLNTCQIMARVDFSLSLKLEQNFYIFYTNHGNPELNDTALNNGNNKAHVISLLPMKTRIIHLSLRPKRAVKRKRVHIMGVAIRPAQKILQEK